VNVLERFKGLFNGLDRVHGKYEIDKDLSSRQVKVAGKAVTVKAAVTTELFQKHLDGEQGLGIVPIRDDQKCVFGALDIDEYDLDLPGLNQQVIDLGLPLVVCRTKSGGAHCYLFSEPIRADIVRKKLKEFAEALGYPKIEIFPKQKEIRPNDVGNWINLPYFDALSGEFDRFAYNAKSEPIMDLLKFCEYGEHMQITLDELKVIKVEKRDLPFNDGPPCLQTLAMRGFPEGTRNTCLLNMGVYTRKKFGDDWKDELEVINHKLMDPPLKAAEVMTIQKSLERKDYHYTCEQSPLCDVCHKDACFGRKYGIGGGDGGAEMETMFGSLRKSVSYNLFGEEIQDENVIWVMDVDGIELQLTTGDLFSQDRFRTKCAERLRKLPLKVRPQRWDAMLKDKIENAELIEFPPETGTYGHIVSALKEFTTRYGEAETRDDILAGKVWRDEEGNMYFQHKDFWKFLIKSGIYRPRDDGKQLHGILRQLGAQKKQLMIDRAKNLNKLCWCVKDFAAPEKDDEMPEAKVPDRPY
jgi:hypothetical protein